MLTHGLGLTFELSERLGVWTMFWSGMSRLPDGQPLEANPRMDLLQQIS